MHLTTLWFALIAILWIGYFVLEGFDFGVGILSPFVCHDDTDRRVLLNAIGPTWDGNEVWLLVAGGATFAAFPEWYASMFSGFYLALFLLLVALIVRGVSFEYRSKIESPRWRTNWDRAVFVCSAVPALLWGVAFANVVRGVPLDENHYYTGSLLTLLNPYALLGGLTTLGLFTLHGATFLSLKTIGDISQRARDVAVRISAPVVVVAACFLLWTQISYGHGWGHLASAAAAVALLLSLVATFSRHEGWAFIGTSSTILLAVTGLFLDLWPDVLPSSTAVANSLTVHNAASSAYTLGVMTWVATVMTPVVLAYQGWTFWIFRQRVGRHDIPAPQH